MGSNPEAEEIGEVYNETLGALSAWPPAAPTHDRWMWEFCSSKCQAAGYCCNDYKIGSNQMISCAQACMMRTRGTSWADMATEKHWICNRNGGSGCSLWVKGHEYPFCSDCQDLTHNPQCKWGVQSPAACEYGALIPPSNWGANP